MGQFLKDGKFVSEIPDISVSLAFGV